MPNHFSTIGFDVQSYQEYVELAELVNSKSIKISTSNGLYLNWTGHLGEQLWLQYDNSGQFIGMNPHFKGKSSVKMNLLSHSRRHCDSVLDGTFEAWTTSENKNSGGVTEKFLFDAPDASRYTEIGFPKTVNAQVAAFGHEVNVQNFINHCNEFDEKIEFKFIRQQLEPFLEFTDESEVIELPEAMVRMSGEVMESAQLCNQITKKPYYWALVKSLGGTYDVVLDHKLARHLPQPGCILSGTYWLSGQINCFN